MPDRIQRINELLKEELSLLVEHDAEELGMISIVAVESTADLSEAQVLVAPLSLHAREQILERLKQHTHDYQAQLGKRLHLKRIPHLQFRLDIHREQLTRIEAIFETIAKEQ